MKPVRMVLAVGLSLAAFITARPAVAGADPMAPPAPLHSAALGAHTHVQPGTTCASHAAHLRRHHHHRAATIRASATTTTRPQPLNPARQRPEHRAALPRVSASGRTHAGPRDGQRAFAAITGLRSLLTVAVAPMDPDQNEIVRGLEGFPLESRGPPRAGPLDSLPPSFAGGLPRYLLSPAPTHRPFGSTVAASPGGLIPAAARARPRTACSYGFTRSQEPLQGCSHACRPEGAAAC
jgi:hypothetical protein